MPSSPKMVASSCVIQPRMVGYCLLEGSGKASLGIPCRVGSWNAHEGIGASTETGISAWGVCRVLSVVASCASSRSLCVACLGKSMAKPGRGITHNMAFSDLGRLGDSWEREWGVGVEILMAWMAWMT